MQRIVKRFLLHQQRESDEKENDVGEIKQDLQMVRFEMINDLKKTREDTFRIVNNIQNGLLILGEEIFKASDFDSIRKFREYKSIDFEGNYCLLNTVKVDLSNENTTLHNNSYSSDSGINSTKESSLYQMKSSEGKNLNSFESLGSSIDTQSSIESINEQLIVNNLKPIDENKPLRSSNDQVIGQEAQKIENRVKFSGSTNELQVINEEEESNSTSNKKKT